MEQLDFNTTLGRGPIAASIKEILMNFENNKSNLSLKRGIYIYGAPGSGKTEFITALLKELNYDVIKYDAGDIRNKSIIETITKHNMADKSVLSLFQEKARPIAILMDEIDGMNNGDKGGINSLIKLIRPKKTKKQKLEEVTFNPIICVSNYHVDKKIKELMKVCSSFELKCPTQLQVEQIIQNTMPELDGVLASNIVKFLQGDLRKLSSLYNIYQNHCSILKNEIIQNIFKPKSYNEDTKEITKKLMNGKFDFSEHLTVMNETDRTIVGLLWHENIIDVIGKMPKDVSIPFYLKVLDNICFADYIDRVTFQKQIWQFNEMSSLIKTFHSNKIYHETFTKLPVFNPAEVRFTKVLTKYSTEYNNSLFIQNLCQQLGLDKKDTFSFFLELRNNYSDEDIYGMFDSYDIGKLDINRIYRYLDKYTRSECVESDV
jgi:DNA polymerase III delta prime subunit